jgi:hypothetical protein
MGLHYKAGDTPNSISVNYNIRIEGSNLVLENFNIPTGYKLYAIKSLGDKTLKFGSQVYNNVSLTGSTLGDLNTSLKDNLFLAKNLELTAGAVLDADYYTIGGTTHSSPVNIEDIVEIS